MADKSHQSASKRIFPSDVCAFCGIDEDNEFLYGHYFKSVDICCHSNCMFFSPALIQTGDENEGFFGFMLPEIEKELLRGSKLNCSFCHKRGATIGCVKSSCKKKFHFPCGLQENALYQYFGSFKSFCLDHRPRQSMKKFPADLLCQICFEPTERDPHDAIYSPCCSNSLFHRLCMQKYASSAGLHFFQCPLCKNDELFVKEMQTHGINIPDKDAAWELEDEAYQDLLLRPSCSAVDCCCPKGRKFNPSKSSNWTLLPCKYCGAQAQHRACAKMRASTKTWLCPECQSFDQKKNEKKISSEPCSSKAAYGKACSSVKLESPVQDIVCDGNSVKLKSLRILCTRVEANNDFEETMQESHGERSREDSGEDQVLSVEKHVTNLMAESSVKTLPHEHSENLNESLSEKELSGHVIDVTSHASDHTENISLPEILSVENENLNSRFPCNPVKDETSVKNTKPCPVHGVSKSRSPKTSNAARKNKRNIEHVCSKDQLCCLKKYFKVEHGKYRL